MKTIDYKRIVEFIGRNGMFKQAGTSIETRKNTKIIGIAPITSKGDVGRCELEIPVENIDEVIQKLVEAKHECGVYMQHPVLTGDDAPSYKVLSEGVLIDDNAYPSWETCRYDESPSGTFYWLDKDQPEYKKVCWIRYDIGQCTFNTCTRDKDGNEVEEQGEYATKTITGSRHHISGVFEDETGETVFRDLIIDLATKECCLVQYPDTETEEAEE